MDKYAIRAVRAKYNGTTYEFPLGVKADNVETSTAKRFTSDKELEALKVTVDSALSKTSKNPVQNAVITSKLEGVETILGAKADVLTVSRTVWISPSGNDDTGDGSETAPWRSIQKALDNVPIINGNAEYFINVQPGTYANFIAANCSARFKLLGDVTIQCTGSYAIRVNNSIIAFEGQGYTLNLVGSDFGVMLYVQNSGMVNTYQLEMTVTGTAADRGIGIEVVSNGGFSHPGKGIVFNNLKQAIVVDTNSRFHAETVSGENITTGISAKAGGIATYETNSIVATTSIETSSGGRVYGGEQELS